MDNDVSTAATIKSLQTALTRERSRADVLAAEVRLRRARTAEHSAACEMGFDDSECGHCREIAKLSNAIAITDSTHALDPAKFEEQR
jgi:hypothetical protein